MSMRSEDQASIQAASKARQASQSRLEKIEQRKQEAARAHAEQASLDLAVAAKTQRLRALRLAKEEADRAAAAEKAAAKKKK